MTRMRLSRPLAATFCLASLAALGSMSPGRYRSPCRPGRRHMARTPEPEANITGCSSGKRRVVFSEKEMVQGLQAQPGGGVVAGAKRDALVNGNGQGIWAGRIFHSRGDNEKPIRDPGPVLKKLSMT